MKSKVKKIVSVLIVFALVMTSICVFPATKTEAASALWGVDVSSHQGVVDWAKMKRAGVDFAIIRLGYGTRYNGTITIDSQFEANVRNARANGIDIGLYLYSYALTVEAAKIEAYGVLEVLKKYPGYFKYPIWYDFEDPGQMKVERASLNAQEIKAFCDILQQAGYYTGVYASRGYLGRNSYIDDTQLGAYDHWIADYGPNDGYSNHGCKYPGSYGMWQYTSNGLRYVPAGTVSSSGLDLNYAYKNYPEIIVNAGLNGFGGGGGTTNISADQKAAAQNLAAFIDAYEARIPRVQLEKNKNLPIFKQYKALVEEARRYVNLDWNGGTSSSYPTAARMWELCAKDAAGGLLESTYTSMRDVVGLDRQGFRKVTQKAIDDWTASGQYTAASLEAAAQVRYDADVRDLGYNNTDVVTENVINDMRAVLVSFAVVPSSVTLNKTSITLNQGDIFTLTATVNPSNVADKSVTWTTSNANVATVSDGKVRAVGTGTADITVKTFNGKTASCSVTVNAFDAFSPVGDNLYDKLISVVDGWARVDSDPNFYDRFSAVYPRATATPTSCIGQLRYASGMLSYLWSNSTFPGYSDSVYKDVQNKYSLPKMGYVNNGGKYYYFLNSGKDVGTAGQRNNSGLIVNGYYTLFRMEVLEDTLGNLNAANAKHIISSKAIPGSLLLVQRQGNYVNSVDLMVVEKATPDGVYVSYQYTTANETNYANQGADGWAKVERHKYISYANLASTYSRHIELLSYITPNIAYNIAPGYDVPSYFARQNLAQTTYTVNFGQNISTQSFPVASRFSSDDNNKIKAGNMYAVSSDTSVVTDIVLNGVSKDGTSAYVSVSARAVGCGTATITVKSPVNDNIQTITVNVKPSVTPVNSIKEFSSAPLSAATGGKAVTWSSSNPSAAKIEGNTLVGVSVGSAIITATSAGHQTSFNVNVTEHDHVVVIDSSVPATCTSTGLTEGSHCSICNKIIVKQEVVPMTEHTVVIDPAVEPTYESTGLTEGSHCSVCGTVIVPQQIIPMLEGPEMPIKFKGAFLNLRSSIAVKFYLDAAVLQEYTDIYAEFTVGGFTIKITDYTIDGNRLIFDYNRLKPSQLAEDIHAVVYGTFNGKVYKNEVSYGVHTYVTNMLKKTSGDASKASFRTLLVDLMCYGAASQIYTNYNTDVLATSFLTSEELKEGTKTVPAFTSVLDRDFKVVDAPEAYFKGASLNLRDAVKIAFSIEAEDLTGLVAKIEVSGKSYVIPATEFAPDAQGRINRYIVVFDKLNAAAMRTPVFITLERNGAAVSNTLRYSIESYAAAKAEMGTSLSELVIAMMKYGDSAKAFTG